MKKINVDLSLCKHPMELHKELAEKLNLPEWYSNNLDSLWDMLTGFIETPIDITLTFMPKSSLSLDLKDLVLKIIELFEAATEEDPSISFKAII